jgi:hypothetical protein
MSYTNGAAHRTGFPRPHAFHGRVADRLPEAKSETRQGAIAALAELEESARTLRLQLEQDRETNRDTRRFETFKSLNSAFLRVCHRLGGIMTLNNLS